MGLQIIKGRRTDKTLEMIRSIKFMAKNDQKTTLLVPSEKIKEETRKVLINNLTAKQMEYVDIIVPSRSGIRAFKIHFDDLDDPLGGVGSELVVDE